MPPRCPPRQRVAQPSPRFDRRRFLAFAAGAPLAPRLRTPTAAGPVERSAFFATTASGDIGFYVRDTWGARFLAGFEALGGRVIAGRPIGCPYWQTPAGPLCQPFERMLLRWNDWTELAEPAPLLDALSAQGLDRELAARFGIPPRASGRPSSACLDSAINVFYNRFGSAATFGDVRSYPQTVGTRVIQRFQNVALARGRRTANEPWEAADVAPLEVGSHARDVGLFPAEALAPETLAIHPFAAPDIVRAGDSAQPVAYLTLDDCRQPEPVAQALDAAAAAGVKLTFFPVGAFLPAAPLLWRRAVAEGHAIENHTQTHGKLSELSDAGIQREIETQRQTLAQVLGFPYPQRFLRPPMGDGVFKLQPRIPRIARSLGLKIAMWSHDSAGYLFRQRTDRTATELVYASVAPKLVAGAVILQHALPAEVAALPHIMALAQDRGLICRTLAEGIA